MFRIQQFAGEESSAGAAPAAAGGANTRRDSEPQQVPQESARRFVPFRRVGRLGGVSFSPAGSGSRANPLMRSSRISVIRFATVPIRSRSFSGTLLVKCGRLAARSPVGRLAPRQRPSVRRTAGQNRSDGAFAASGMCRSSPTAPTSRGSARSTDHRRSGNASTISPHRSAVLRWHRSNHWIV